MNKYEISIWEDFPDKTERDIPFLNERKICIIGSNTMTSSARAREPKMVQNINGTHTFTFKMFYNYIDEYTGEKCANPFTSYLINERKIKVFWQDEWYDLIIKNIDEDSNSNSATYTCKDLFITELSKNGYNIELTSDLQNNSGTAFELVERVLENSGWSLNRQNSSKIYQYLDTPVYEAIVTNSNLIAYEITYDLDESLSISSPISAILIEPGQKILVSKQSLDAALKSSDSTKYINILYNNGEPFITHQNEMLVRNGTIYNIQVEITSNLNGYTLTQNSAIVEISEISSNYRMKELIKSQKTVYDPVFQRYVGVYKTNEVVPKEIYGFSRTEYTNPITVTNLIVNSSNFQNTTGWLPSDSDVDNFNLSWIAYPGLTDGQNLDNYVSKGYLRIPGTGYNNDNKYRTIFNSGLIANANILTPTVGEITDGINGGFNKGEKYVFRIKAYDINNGSISSYGLKNYFRFDVCKFTVDYKKSGNSYFTWSTPDWANTNPGWAECILECTTSCPAEEISTLGLFLTHKYNLDVCIEDIQFFKYEQGLDSNNNIVRINPGEITTAGITKTIYKYYEPVAEDRDPKSVIFVYTGEEDSTSFTPIMTYEKITTIDAKGSNRFNILQSIAENFECWIRFNIEHDENGKILLDEETQLPKKEVYLVENIGKDLGWSFIYGIDLKTIKRKIISEDIVTKTIVLTNNNEFAKNGFCTIERSQYNYPKESFILNFDYYIDQGLLNRRELDLDLYNTFDDHIGYYTLLNRYNNEYNQFTDQLIQKKKELNQQKPELESLELKIHNTTEQIEKLRQDVVFLTGKSSYNNISKSDLENNTKARNTVITISQLSSNLQQYRINYTTLQNSIQSLTSEINTLTIYQEAIIESLEELHTSFFRKYSRYIQEGVWQSENYVDDDKYYLDALNVAYTSSRPKVQYDINVIRLNYLEDFTSKKFNVGDICYIQDKDFFGTVDGTPFKLQIVISEITSYFDSPEKDTIKVQNYKTQFEDLFQRITATTQMLQYSSGGFQRAADAIQPDKTLNFNLLQKTFDYNNTFILNAANQDVTWDQTGITIKDSSNSSQLVRIMSGGLFVSNDGGLTWKNAVRGDGISANVLTAGQINTSEIYIYSGDQPSFRWDSNGLTAYKWNNSNVDFTKFVRYDQYGLYGLIDGSQDFVPSNINDVINNATFGLTWNGFFMKATDGSGSVIINSNDNNVIKCINGNNNVTFSLNKNGSANFAGEVVASSGTIGGWHVTTNDNGVELNRTDNIKYYDKQFGSGALIASSVPYPLYFTYFWANAYRVRKADDSGWESFSGTAESHSYGPYYETREDGTGARLLGTNYNSIIYIDLVQLYRLCAKDGDWSRYDRLYLYKTTPSNSSGTIDYQGNEYPVWTNTNGVKIEGFLKPTSGFIGLTPKDQNMKISVAGSEAKTNWRLIVGNKFGVDSTGTLYATNGYFSGDITADTGIIKVGVNFGQYITINQARQGSGDGATTDQQGITFEQINANNSKAGLGINQNGVWLRRKDGGWASFNSQGWSAASASDIRLKENINYDLTDYKNVLKELKLFSYNLKSTVEKNTLFGVSAQQLHALLLDKNIDVSKFSFLKIPKENSVFNSNDASTFYQIDYQFLPPLLLSIVQDQQKEIEQLKTEIENLKQ